MASTALHKMTDPSKYKFNHSMIRVKDPQASISFYKHLGLSLLEHLKFPESKFDLYLLAHDTPAAISHGRHRSDREGIVELTHNVNYGTENDSGYKISNGNRSSHKGFCQFGISVDDRQAASRRIADAGYRVSNLTNGHDPDAVTFAQDPDGYFIELIQKASSVDQDRRNDTDSRTHRLNHTMIRVKDPQISVEFYKGVLDMVELHVLKNESAGFDLFFLGCGAKVTDQSSGGLDKIADCEGLLGLRWECGTEKEEGQVYHNGNVEPQGVGHTCVAVDDIEKACVRFDQLGVQWKKRLTDGKMSNIAFILGTIC